MSRREQPGSRWNDSLQSEPTTDPTHLQKPDQKIRRIRQGRLPGALFGSSAPSILAEATAAPASGDVPAPDTIACLAAMRFYQSALRRDGDSYAAWVGLSYVFEALRDDRRAGQCRGVARRLRRFSRYATATG